MCDIYLAFKLRLKHFMTIKDLHSNKAHIKFNLIINVVYKLNFPELYYIFQNIIILFRNYEN